MADGDCKTKLACIGEGCTKSPWARGMCKTHYSRWRIHGDCNKVIRQVKLPPTCEVEGCDIRPHTRWKRGMAVCNRHWQYLYRYGQLTPPPDAPPEPLPLCVVHKCNTAVRSRGSNYCEKHYGRARRGVEIEGEKAPLYRYISDAGYVILIRQEHPLAKQDGRIAEHRLVAYEKHGGICPQCYWCGKALGWDTAVVDHLNEVKSDNRPDNLLVACNRCNRARGAMLPFIAAMRQEAFGVLVDAMREYREAHRHGDKQRDEASKS